MSTINFDDFWGRISLLPMDENGERKRATISDHVHTLDQAQLSREDKLRLKLKFDGELLDDLISYNQLMEYLVDNIDTGLMRMVTTNSSLSRITEAYILLQTQNILDIGTIYLLNGRLLDGLSITMQHHC